MKNFRLPNAVRADGFRQVLWQFLSARRSRALLGRAGVSEMHSNYFQNTAHFRNSQAIFSTAAFGGYQIVRNFRGKNQLAILNS